MITIREDGKPTAKVSLINGKLKVDYIDKKAAEPVLKAMRGLFTDKPLTDEEVYRTIPFRLQGRITAGLSGDDAETLRDPSVYDGLQKQADAEYEADPKIQALRKQSEARLGKPTADSGTK